MTDSLTTGITSDLDKMKKIYYWVQDKIAYVEEFSELGKFLNEPVRNYSSGMRARLAFALSMVIEFDCFLIDEVVAVGDSRFHEKCKHELFEKRKDRAIIIVSHQHEQIVAHCQKAAVLDKGQLRCFDDVQEAYAYYQSDACMQAI